MKKNIYMISVIVGFFAVSTMTSFLFPREASAIAPSPACDRKILTIPAWYNGLMTPGQDAPCEFRPEVVTDSSNKPLNVSQVSLRITLNVIDAIMQITAYASAIFVIYGGFKYMIAQGEAGNIEKAKKTILNAIIGLIIAILAASIVGFINASLFK